MLLDGNAVLNNNNIIVSDASEFVSGSQTITKDGTYDVTNYAEVDVNVGGGSANLQSSKSYTVAASGSQTISPDSGYDGMEEVALSVPAGTAGTPTASKGTVSNYSVTVTPSVTNTAGYISGGIVNGTSVTVTASELISFSTIRTGSETPSSSLGVDGDIYIQTSGGS